MSLTLSPPIRATALVGALVLTGLAAVVFLLGRGPLSGGEPSAAEAVPLVPPAAQVTPKPKPAAAPRVEPKPKPRMESGFPAKIDHALRYSKVVVVSVSVPGAPVDAIVRREARTAANTSRAGFVAISAANERALAGLVAKAGVLPAPAVVVIRRPGVVTSTFSVTDAGTIAQAVAQARR